MAKDKPAMRRTMRDIASKNSSRTNPTPTQANNTVPDFIDVKAEFDNNFNDKVKQYNSNLTTLDKDFSELKPTFRFLVRPYLKPIREENGLLLPDVEIHYGQTQNGMPGVKIEDSFPFTSKAVVISVPIGVREGAKYKAGDIVIIQPQALKKTLSGRGYEEVKQDIENKFIHPDFPTDSIPTDPTDKNYGYIMVQEHEIDFIM